MLMLIEKQRIKELDFLRGLLIVLMIVDHFFLLYFNLSNYYSVVNTSLYGAANYYLNHDARNIIRFIVMSIFFVISGICCNFSKNNLSRAFKLAFASSFFSLLTYLISIFTKYDCFVICGVLHCYTIYVFSYCLFKKFLNGKIDFLVNFILILSLLSILFLINDFRVSGTNMFIYFGLPEKTYVAPFEYVSSPEYIWAFYMGVLIGETLYKDHKYSYLKYNIPFISWIGEKSIYFYFLHFPILLILILKIF